MEHSVGMLVGPNSNQVASSLHGGINYDICQLANRLVSQSHCPPVSYSLTVGPLVLHVEMQRNYRF